MRILHVDDNYDVAAVIDRLLRKERFAVDHTTSVRYADEMMTIDEYDLVLLEARLPDGSGFEFCCKIRKMGFDIPVMMLTVLSDPEYRVSGLECGADDYVCKPFHSGELIARVRTLLRRSARAPTTRLQVADLALDPARRTVTRADERIDLLPKEFAILEYLLRRIGLVRTKDQIGENVWGVEYDPRSNLIESYISRLRRKVERAGSQRIIETVKGVGYRIAEPPPCDG